LVAFALLQICQQAISAFSPRPAIQVCLVVAVGLLSLTAERLRQSEGQIDRLGVVSASGCLVALVTATAVTVLAGFSTSTPPPIAEQVDAVRAHLQKAGLQVTTTEVPLNAEAPSRLFVVSNPRSPSTSDEIRIYEPVAGVLKLHFRYRPVVTDPAEPASRPLGARFVMLGAIDVNGDGQREIIGAYQTNQAEFQRVPVLISQDSGSVRYRLALLLSGLSPEVTRGLPRYEIGTAGGVRQTTAWVSDLGLEPGGPFGRAQPVLVTHVLSQGDPHGLGLTVDSTRHSVTAPILFPAVLRFWSFEPQTASPAVMPLCVKGGQEAAIHHHVTMADPGVRLERIFGQELAGVMKDLSLWDYYEGHCAEPASAESAQGLD
jgi:hypothetical protein